MFSFNAIYHVIVKYNLFFFLFHRYTSQNAFKQILQEVTSIANQHELIGEFLMNSVLKELQALTSELRQERKKYLQEFKQEDNNLERSIKKLESVRSP